MFIYKYVSEIIVTCSDIMFVSNALYMFLNHFAKVVFTYVVMSLDYPASFPVAYKLRKLTITIIVYSVYVNGIRRSMHWTQGRHHKNMTCHQ